YALKPTDRLLWDMCFNTNEDGRAFFAARRPQPTRLERILRLRKSLRAAKVAQRRGGGDGDQPLDKLVARPEDGQPPPTVWDTGKGWRVAERETWADQATEPLTDAAFDDEEDAFLGDEGGPVMAPGAVSAARELNQARPVEAAEDDTYSDASASSWSEGEESDVVAELRAAPLVLHRAGPQAGDPGNRLEEKLRSLVSLTDSLEDIHASESSGTPLDSPRSSSSVTLSEASSQSRGMKGRGDGTTGRPQSAKASRAEEAMHSRPQWGTRPASAKPALRSKRHEVFAHRRAVSEGAQQPPAPSGAADPSRNLTQFLMPPAEAAFPTSALPQRMPQGDSADAEGSVASETTAVDVEYGAMRELPAGRYMLTCGDPSFSLLFAIRKEDKVCRQLDGFLGRPGETSSVELELLHDQIPVHEPRLNRYEVFDDTLPTIEDIYTDNTAMKFMGHGAGKQQLKYTPIEVYIRRRPRIQVAVEEPTSGDALARHFNFHFWVYQMPRVRRLPHIWRGGNAVDEQHMSFDPEAEKAEAELEAARAELLDQRWTQHTRCAWDGGAEPPKPHRDALLVYRGKLGPGLGPGGGVCHACHDKRIEATLDTMWVEPGFVYCVRMHAPSVFVDGPYVQMRLIDWDFSTFVFELHRKVQVTMAVQEQHSGEPIPNCVCDVSVTLPNSPCPSLPAPPRILRPVPAPPLEPPEHLPEDKRNQLRAQLAAAAAATAETQHVARRGKTLMGWMRSYLLQLADWVVETKSTDERLTQQEMKTDAKGRLNLYLPCGSTVELHAIPVEPFCRNYGPFGRRESPKYPFSTYHTPPPPEMTIIGPLGPIAQIIPPIHRANIPTTRAHAAVWLSGGPGFAHPHFTPFTMTNGPPPGWTVWPPINSGPLMDEITGEVLVPPPVIEVQLVRKSRAVVRCVDEDTGAPVVACRLMVGILVPEDRQRLFERRNAVTAIDILNDLKGLSLKDTDWNNLRVASCYNSRVELDAWGEAAGADGDPELDAHAREAELRDGSADDARWNDEEVAELFRGALGQQRRGMIVIHAWTDVDGLCAAELPAGAPAVATILEVPYRFYAPRMHCGPGVQRYKAQWNVSGREEAVEFGVYRKPYISVRTIDKCTGEEVQGTLFQVFVATSGNHTNEMMAREWGLPMDADTLQEEPDERFEPEGAGGEAEGILQNNGVAFAFDNDYQERDQELTDVIKDFPSGTGGSHQPFRLVYTNHTGGPGANDMCLPPDCLVVVRVWPVWPFLPGPIEVRRQVPPDGHGGLDPAEFWLTRDVAAAAFWLERDTNLAGLFGDPDATNPLARLQPMCASDAVLAPAAPNPMPEPGGGDHIVHRWPKSFLGDPSVLKLESRRLIHLLKKWGAFPHVEGGRCSCIAIDRQAARQQNLQAQYCQGPFHHYSFRNSNKAYHVGKHEKLLWELHHLEEQLAASLELLKAEIPKVHAHNSALSDGGRLLFGSRALLSDKGGVFVLDTGGGLPTGGLGMITAQLEELLENWSMRGLPSCRFNVLLSSYTAAPPARAARRPIVITPSSAAAACSWAYENGDLMLGEPLGSTRGNDGSLMSTPRDGSIISWASEDGTPRSGKSREEEWQPGPAEAVLEEWDGSPVPGGFTPAARLSTEQSGDFGSPSRSRGQGGGGNSLRASEVHYEDGLLLALRAAHEERDVSSIYLVVNQDRPFPEKGAVEVLEAVQMWRNVRRIPLHTIVVARNTPVVEHPDVANASNVPSAATSRADIAQAGFSYSTPAPAGGSAEGADDQPGPSIMIHEQEILRERLEFLGLSNPSGPSGLRGPGGVNITDSGPMVRLMRELSADSGGRFCWVDLDGIRQRTEPIEDTKLREAMLPLQRELEEVRHFKETYEKALRQGDGYFYYDGKYNTRPFNAQTPATRRKERARPQSATDIREQGSVPDFHLSASQSAQTLGFRQSQRSLESPTRRRDDVQKAEGPSVYTLPREHWPKVRRPTSAQKTSKYREELRARMTTKRRSKSPSPTRSPAGLYERHTPSRSSPQPDDGTMARETSERLPPRSSMASVGRMRPLSAGRAGPGGKQLWRG
ncbi:hypothetical protein CYMTET_4931, partial [Cymbomonas tetramitiformis]